MAIASNEGDEAGAEFEYQKRRASSTDRSPGNLKNQKADALGAEFRELLAGAAAQEENPRQLKIIMKHTTEQKRKLLIGEIRCALNCQNEYSDSTLLYICNLSEATITEDLNNKQAPWVVLCMHYYTLGRRALRERIAGRIPDGSSFSERVKATALRVGRMMSSRRRRSRPVQTH
jgi:hypothetical protein